MERHNYNIHRVLWKLERLGFIYKFDVNNFDEMIFVQSSNDTSVNCKVT